MIALKKIPGPEADFFFFLISEKCSFMVSVHSDFGMVTATKLMTSIYCF